MKRHIPLPRRNERTQKSANIETVCDKTQKNPEQRKHALDSFNIIPKKKIVVHFDQKANYKHPKKIIPQYANQIFQDDLPPFISLLYLK